MRQRFGDHLRKRHPNKSGEQLNELQGVGPLHHNLNGLATPLGVTAVGKNGGDDDPMAL